MQVQTTKYKSNRQPKFKENYVNLGNNLNSNKKSGGRYYDIHQRMLDALCYSIKVNFAQELIH
jgi:hypothetical protein